MEYKILWVDDSPDWVDSIRESIENHIRDLGLDPNIEIIDDGGQAEERANQPDLDLILMDYQLPETNGDELIQRIRNQGSFVEIVFYSQEDLDPTALIGTTEGLYITTRDSAQQKFLDVIDITLKKFTDLRVLRGMVITECIDIEVKLEEVVKKKFGDRGDLLDRRIIRKGWLDYGKKISLTIGLLNDRIDELGQDDPQITVLEGIKNILNSLDKEVMQCRNILAHSVAEYSDDGSIVLKGLSKSLKKIDITKEWIAQHRENLAKHRNNLELLLENI